MNQKLIDAAERGLTAKGFETAPHYCQRWVKQVIEQVYGQKYMKLCKANAVKSGIAFRDAGFSVPLTRGSVPGDILYKLTGSGGDGHVGIRIPGNRVAENSSLHWDGDDARGTRSLIEFGHFDLIIRLPQAK